MPSRNERTASQTGTQVPDVTNGDNIDPEPTSDDYGASGYVPWVPQIGEMVRVRISAECPRTGHDHWLEEDGAVGEVRKLMDHHEGHPYWVIYAFPVSVPETMLGHGMMWGFYEATELEPLTVCER